MKKEERKQLVGRKYKFYGLVQGVNFRYTTVNISKNYEVTGYVKNLDDGTVELVAYGMDDEIENFVNAVKSRFRRNITQVETEQLPYSQKYGNFVIEY